MTYVIPSDSLYPRDEEHRYRIYARKGDKLTVLAATDIDGIGLALVTLDDDEREYGRSLLDLGAIGILDSVDGRWIVLPWQRYDGSATMIVP